MGPVCRNLCSVARVLPPGPLTVPLSSSQEIAEDSPSRARGEPMLSLWCRPDTACPHAGSAAWHFFPHFGSPSPALPPSRGGRGLCPTLCLLDPPCCISPFHPHLPQGVSDFIATTHDGETQTKPRSVFIYLKPFICLILQGPTDRGLLPETCFPASDLGKVES